jgi:hypothetical protein
MPVRTRADAIPARFAPRMSVSSRSPMKSGFDAPKRTFASSKIGTSGFPATVARRPTAVWTADTSVPFPGAIPRACGMVQSVFVATHGSSDPSAVGVCSANAASASCDQPTSGAKPWITAAGESSAERVTTKPPFSTSSTSPAPPTTRIVDPAGTRPARSRTAACGLVTTSAGATLRPRSVRCCATEASVREALFVMYPTRTCSAARFSDSTACGIGFGPA